MFGNNKDFMTPEQLDELLKPLLERVQKLETTVGRQAAQLEALRSRLEAQADGVAAVVSHDAVEDKVELELGDTIALEVPPVVADTAWYLPAPTPDGQFAEGSATLQVGKSIYRLRSADGHNGYFEMLSSPDALATALISVSQFVKPVCRIEGNTHRLPQRVETVEEGTAQRDGNGWRVVRKATVKFE
jgi:hypothetical protein